MPFSFATLDLSLRFLFVLGCAVCAVVLVAMTRLFMVRRKLAQRTREEQGNKLRISAPLEVRNSLAIEGRSSFSVELERARVNEDENRLRSTASLPDLKDASTLFGVRALDAGIYAGIAQSPRPSLETGRPSLDTVHRPASPFSNSLSQSRPASPALSEPEQRSARAPLIARQPARRVSQEHRRHLQSLAAGIARARSPLRQEISNEDYFSRKNHSPAGKDHMALSPPVAEGMMQMSPPQSTKTLPPLPPQATSDAFSHWPMQTQSTSVQTQSLSQDFSDGEDSMLQRPRPSYPRNPSTRNRRPLVSLGPPPQDLKSPPPVPLLPVNTYQPTASASGGLYVTNPDASYHDTPLHNHPNTQRTSSASATSSAPSMSTQATTLSTDIDIDDSPRRSVLHDWGTDVFQQIDNGLHAVHAQRASRLARQGHHHRATPSTVSVGSVYSPMDDAETKPEGLRQTQRFTPEEIIRYNTQNVNMNYETSLSRSDSLPPIVNSLEEYRWLTATPPSKAQHRVVPSFPLPSPTQDLKESIIRVQRDAYETAMRQESRSGSHGGEERDVSSEMGDMQSGIDDEDEMDWSWERRARPDDSLFV